jgi:hypothetical protein
LAFVGAAIVGAFATSASAQITLTDPALRIEASNSSGSGFIDFSLDPGAWNPDGSYFWFLMGGPMQIMDGPNVIATVTAASVSAGNLPYKTMGIGFTVFPVTVTRRSPRPARCPASFPRFRVKPARPAASR